MNQDSSGRVVTLSQGARPTSQGSVSSRVRDLSVLHSIQNGIRAYPVLSLGVKQAGNEDGCLPPSYAKFKNVWMYTKTCVQGIEHN